MSDVRVCSLAFEGKPLEVLQVEGRPALVAAQLGAIAGCGGRPLPALVRWEWASEFTVRRDYAILRGVQLDSLRGGVTELGPDAAELVVLFESGVHTALLKMPTASRNVRRFLVDEVLPRLARPSAADAMVELVREVGALRRVELDDRMFQVDELRYTTMILHDAGYLDNDGWAACAARACEIAIGAPLVDLKRRGQRGWVSAEELGDRFALPGEGVVDVAVRLGLTDQPTDALPVPLRGASGWTVSFRFSPKAATLIEAWLESPDPGSESRVA